MSGFGACIHGIAVLFNNGRLGDGSDYDTRALDFDVAEDTAIANKLRAGRDLAVLDGVAEDILALDLGEDAAVLFSLACLEAEAALEIEVIHHAPEEAGGAARQVGDFAASTADLKLERLREREELLGSDGWSGAIWHDT